MKMIYLIMLLLLCSPFVIAADKVGIRNKPNMTYTYNTEINHEQNYFIRYMRAHFSDSNGTLINETYDLSRCEFSDKFSMSYYSKDDKGDEKEVSEFYMQVVSFNLTSIKLRFDVDEIFKDQIVPLTVYNSDDSIKTYSGVATDRPSLEQTYVLDYTLGDTIKFGSNSSYVTIDYNNITYDYYIQGNRNSCASFQSSLSSTIEFEVNTSLAAYEILNASLYLYLTDNGKFTSWNISILNVTGRPSTTSAICDDVNNQPRYNTTTVTEVNAGSNWIYLDIQEQFEQALFFADGYMNIKMTASNYPSNNCNSAISIATLWVGCTNVYESPYSSDNADTSKRPYIKVYYQAAEEPPPEDCWTETATDIIIPSGCSFITDGTVLI